MTQAGHTLWLRQPRIQGPPLSAGGTPAACAAAEAALPPAHPARSPPPRSSSPPHTARRRDLEGEECLPIGHRPRPYGLCADSPGSPLPRSGGSALGSARNHADHGLWFDTSAFVSPELTSSGALQFRCFRARKPPHSVRTST